MTDPVRLLASADATDLEKQLLGSWSDERPAPAARDKTLAVLGLAGGAAAGAATAGGSIAPKAIATGWLAVAKWLAVGVVAVGAAAAGIGVAHRLGRHAGAPAATPSAPAPVVAVPAARATAAPPGTVIELPAAPAVRHAPARTVTAAPSSIGRQVAALDRARAALDQGDAPRAGRLVDEYEAAYPAGEFRQEADVLRIEALVREGKSEDAARAGRRFLATYPQSPHDARVRSLLGYAPRE
jgi:TolA-binding protein